LVGAAINLNGRLIFVDVLDRILAVYFLVILFCQILIFVETSVREAAPVVPIWL